MDKSKNNVTKTFTQYFQVIKFKFNVGPLNCMVHDLSLRPASNFRSSVTHLARWDYGLVQ